MKRKFSAPPGGNALWKRQRSDETDARFKSWRALMSGLDSPNEEQSSVIRTILNSKYSFITGPPGCGKSLLIKHLLDKLRRSLGWERIKPTTPTNSVAITLMADTINSFIGSGVTIPEDAESHAKFLKAYKPGVWHGLNTCEWIIFEEISMINPDLFVLCDELLQIARRRKGVPFGGVRVVACGDFYQLPPVKYDGYVFEKKSWDAFKFGGHFLESNFRQKDDPAFYKLLTEIRSGSKLSDESKALLDECMKTFEERGIKDKGEPMHMYSRNADSDACNRSRYAELTGREVTYRASDMAKTEAREYEVFESIYFLKTLSLKVGTRVMLTSNEFKKNGVANSDMGTVVGFDIDIPISRRNPHLERTLHTTIESPGPIDIGSTQVFPKVRFDNGVTMLVQPVFQERLFNKKVVARRNQLPLRYAWACSVHKLQGMTLNCVDGRIDDCFEFGQAYVFLSRARDSRSVHIDGWSEDKLRPDTRVINFMRGAFPHKFIEE